MFVKDSDHFDVVFYCCQRGYRMRVVSGTDYQKLSMAKKEGLKKQVVTFRGLSWGAYNNIRRVATIDNPETNRREFDASTYVVEKLLSAIVSWDFTEKTVDGEERIPVTRENCERLHPKVAEFLINYYDGQDELSEADQKKL